jgi:phosphoribosylformylglycinamidine cyclo-ligase
MPGMYSEEDFDLAGFAVGVAEEDELNPKVKDGDILLALPSSGIHSNGYSLVRKLFFEKLNMKFDDDFNGKPLIETLLTPTRIYVKEFKKFKDKINALAHITGGGIVENLPRVLPDDLEAVVYKDKIKVLPIFEFMKQYVDESEMYRTFNMGVGLVLAVDEKNLDYILSNSDAYVIGEIKKGKKGVNLK